MQKKQKRAPSDTPKATAQKKGTPVTKQKSSSSTPSSDPVASFLSWCSRVRLTHPKCTVGQLPGTGRGVVATAPIREGEVVIEVPDDVVLMVESSCIAAELEGAGLSKAAGGDALLEVQGLVLAVMAEKVAGPHSPWAHYLSFIPKDMTHMPMYWQESDLAALSGTAALDKMEGKVQTPADAPTQVRLLWEEVAEPFIQEHPRLRLPTGERGWALYQWSTAAVASYSFILGDDHYQAMVPFWDALNHITGAVNVRLNHHTARGGAGRLQMIATRDIAEGEELVNNYGELSQAELLRGYGYVERHADANKYAHVQVPLRFVLQTVGSVLQAQSSESAVPRQLVPLSPSAEAAEAEKEALCGSDSEGASDWGLDTDSDDDLADGEEQSAETERGEAQADGSAKAEGMGNACQLQGEGREAGGEDKQAQGEGATADASMEPRTRRARAWPSARADPGARPAAEETGRAGTSTSTCSQMLEGAAGLGCGSMRMRAVQGAVRGLPGRLRFLRRVGLLPRANVFKVFMPTAQDTRPGSAVLAEAVRLLLLPRHTFCAVRANVQSWRPQQTVTSHSDAENGLPTLMSDGRACRRPSTAALDTMQDTAGAHAGVHPTGPSGQHQAGNGQVNQQASGVEVAAGGALGAETAAGLAAAARAGAGMGATAAAGRTTEAAVCQGLVVDVGPAGPAIAGQVQLALRLITEHMLGRYTCSLEADEQLLAASPPAVPVPAAADAAVRLGSEAGAGTGPADMPIAAGRKLSSRQLAAVVARMPEKQCLHALARWWDGGAGIEEAEPELGMQRVVRECWSQPRPGMFGMPSVASRSDDDGDDDSSNTDGSSTGDGEGNDGSGDGDVPSSLESSDDDGVYGAAGNRSRPGGGHGLKHGARRGPGCKNASASVARGSKGARGAEVQTAGGDGQNGHSQKRWQSQVQAADAPGDVLVEELPCKHAKTEGFAFSFQL